MTETNPQRIGTPTQHDAALAAARLWRTLPMGLGRDLNIILVRLENLERAK